MSKKNSPKLSPEAAAEQRRLSLAALTAGVSTVNMLGLELPAAPAVATRSTVKPWAVRPATMPLAISSSSSQTSTCMVNPLQNVRVIKKAVD